MRLVKNDILGVPLLSSLAIHICVIGLAAMTPHSKQLRRQDFLPVSLVDLPRTESAPPHNQIKAPREVNAPDTPRPKANNPKKTKPVPERELARMTNVELPEPEAAAPLRVPPKDVPAKIEAVESAAPAQAAPPANFSSGSIAEGGGSEAGAGNLNGTGEVGISAGPGTAGGGGGTASYGLGRGSGAPGLPAQTAPLKTNRHAKPIQTVRASYPPMALRAGLESDVALRIEVDTEGKVTNAEIIKSGGTGFDEEALSAVKQSRFEPARRDGQHVPAEFTYIYRFRLRR